MTFNSTFVGFHSQGNVGHGAEPSGYLGGMERAWDLKTMGGRFGWRVRESLGITFAEVVRRVNLAGGDLGIQVTHEQLRKFAASSGSSLSQSELVAEAIDVSHRWLQIGDVPMARNLGWPFPRLDPVKLLRISEESPDILSQLEASVMSLAPQLGVDVRNRSEDKSAPPKSTTSRKRA